MFLVVGDSCCRRFSKPGTNLFDIYLKYVCDLCYGKEVVVLWFIVSTFGCILIHSLY